MILVLTYALAFLAWMVLPEVALPPNAYLAMDPVTIGLIILAVTASAAIAGAGVQIDASIKQSEAQSKTLKEKARAEQARGYAEEERIRDMNRRRLRKMREAIGTSGVRSDLGTPLDTYLNEQGSAEIDALNVRIGANYAAAQSRAAASNSLAAGKTAAIGQGIGLVGDLGSLALTGLTATQAVKEN
tara:strand:+ start:3874 stop:4434 length:561 start_codon:yes stop_codon:yes gene_type:complete